VENNLGETEPLQNPTGLHATKPFDFQTDPLLPVAAALIAGIAVGAGITWPAVITLEFAAICLLLWLVCTAFTRIKASPLIWINLIRHCFLTAAIFFSGVLLYQINQTQFAPNDVSLAAPANGRVLITARMLITSAPEYRAPDTNGPLFSIQEPYTTFTAKVRQSFVGGKWIPVTGNVQVNASGSLPALKNNQQIRVEGWLSKPPTAANPGDFDDREYLARSGVFACITAEDPSEVSIISDRQTLLPLSGWLDNLRLAARQRLLNCLGQNQQGYALVALLLGYRDPSIEPITQNFSNAGAAHLLALSGLHVVIIAGAFWLVLKLFIRRPRRRAAVTLVLILIYVLLTPCGPPVLRAGIGTAWVLLTMMMGRPVRIVNILAGTAIINVLYQPTDIFSSPFQLTFLVTFALIMLADRTHQALFGAWLARRADILRAGPTTWRKISYATAKWLTLAFCANLIGAVVSFPLVAWHYHQINPLGVINGLILLPFIIFVLAAGVMVLAGSLISSAAGHIAAIPVLWLLNIQAWLVAHLAALPGSNFIVRAPPPVLIVLIYAVIAAWIFRKKLRIPRVVIAGAFAAWLIVLPVDYEISASQEPTRLWVLDTGAGDALVLQTPEGNSTLIDAGALGSPEHVADVVTQLLRVSGRREINDAIITQVDPAHAGALAAVVNGRKGLALYCDAIDLADGGQTYEIRRFFDDQNFAHAVFSPLHAGSRININRDASIDVLWPSDSLAISQRSIRGCVLLVHLNGQSVLILDRTQISPEVEAALSNVAAPDAAILMGPGSLKADDQAWLANLNPILVILSGENRESIQADSVILAGRKFFQTANAGAIELAGEDDGIHVVNWKN